VLATVTDSSWDGKPQMTVNNNNNNNNNDATAATLSIEQLPVWSNEDATVGTWIHAAMR
jgi:hypothetical protein